MTRLISLTVKNYRPFYGTTTFDFSTNKNKNFNVIYAGTGGGKTTFLNMLSWCLYNEEKHKKQPLDTMLNDKKREQLKKGDAVDVMVEMVLGEDQKNIDYVFIRKITFYKDDNGKVRAIPNSIEFRVKVKDTRNNLIDASGPEGMVDRVFPEEIQHLFMFDGEQLQTFFDEGNIKNTKTAITDITQINFLESAIEHLKNFSKNYKTGEIEETKEIKENRIMLESAIKEIDRRNIEKSEVTDELNIAKEKHKEAQEKLEKIGGKDKDLKEIIQNEKKTRESLDYEQQNLNEKEEEEFDHLLTSVPFIFCRDELRKLLEIIGNKYESGELPPGIRYDFLKKLLEKGKCICGCSLDAGSKERKLVEEYKDKAPLSIYEDQIRKGEFEIRKKIEESEKFLGKRKELHNEIEKIKNRISNLNDTLRILEKKRKGLDEEEIESICSIRDFQFSKVEEYREKLGGIKIAISNAETCKINCGERQRKMEREQIKNKDKRKRFDICGLSITFLESIKTNLLTEIKQEIEKKTDTICRSGLKNEDRIDKIIIDDNFELQILKKSKFGGGFMYEELSQGQKEIVATSFIIALRKESGFDSPIFFDFPFGKLDPQKGKELIESLKMILKEVQVNFLLIGDREFGQLEKDLMKDCLGSVYEIRKVLDEPRSEVIKK